MSFVKYLIWTGVAALLVAGANEIDHVLPIWMVPFVAATLKGLATQFQNWLNENKPK